MTRDRLGKEHKEMPGKRNQPILNCMAVKNVEDEKGRNIRKKLEFSV